MKLKMAQVVNAYNWATAMRDKSISYTAAFLIASNLSNIEKEIKSFETQKMAMLEKYGKKGPEGKLVINDDKTVELEDKESFTDEFEKLLECEVNVTINKIPMEEMKDLSISLEQMVSVAFLFTSPAVESKKEITNYGTMVSNSSNNN